MPKFTRPSANLSLSLLAVIYSNGRCVQYLHVKQTYRHTASLRPQGVLVKPHMLCSQSLSNPCRLYQMRCSIMHASQRLRRGAQLTSTRSPVALSAWPSSLAILHHPPRQTFTIPHPLPTSPTSSLFHLFNVLQLFTLAAHHNPAKTSLVVCTGQIEISTCASLQM